MSASATYLCGACGNVAATVTLLAPGEREHTPGLLGVPRVSGTYHPGDAELLIDGGPVSMSRIPVPMEEVAIALETGAAATLFAVNWEYAPFWCPECGASYCREHYVRHDEWDAPFVCVDVYAVCTKGHERLVMD